VPGTSNARSTKCRPFKGISCTTFLSITCLPSWRRFDDRLGLSTVMTDDALAVQPEILHRFWLTATTNDGAICD